MTGQRIGYIRISSFDQHPERQLEGISVINPFLTRRLARILTVRSWQP